MSLWVKLRSLVPRFTFPLSFISWTYKAGPNSKPEQSHTLFVPSSLRFLPCPSLLIRSLGSRSQKPKTWHNKCQPTSSRSERMHCWSFPAETWSAMEKSMFERVISLPSSRMQMGDLSWWEAFMSVNSLFVFYPPHCIAINQSGDLLPKRIVGRRALFKKFNNRRAEPEEEFNYWIPTAIFPCVSVTKNLNLTFGRFSRFLDLLPPLFEYWTGHRKVTFAWDRMSRRSLVYGLLVCFCLTVVIPEVLDRRSVKQCPSLWYGEAKNVVELNLWVEAFWRGYLALYFVT